MAVDWVPGWVTPGFCSCSVTFVVSCRLSSTALAVPVPGCYRVLVSSICAWNIGVLETCPRWLFVLSVGGLFVQRDCMASNSTSNLCIMASLQLRNWGSVLILFIICSCSLKYRYACFPFTITLEVVWYSMMQNFRPPFLLSLVWLFNCILVSTFVSNWSALSLMVIIYG